MKRWVFGVLATCGVTAAIAVPLLAQSRATRHPAPSASPPALKTLFVSTGKPRLRTRAQFIAFCNKHYPTPHRQFCLAIARRLPH